MNLLEHVETMTDPRKRRGVRHPICPILKAVLLAVIAGMTCIEHIAGYVKEHWE